MHKGIQLSSQQRMNQAPFVIDNVWWLMHQASRVYISAYEDMRTGQLREIPLPKCIEIWGLHPFGRLSLTPEAVLQKNESSVTAYTRGQRFTLPLVAPKYLKWLGSREKICREISSMSKLRGHENIIELNEVLELVQDSKTTLFLVMELVTGGELFERIPEGGTPEEFARHYFCQLLSGIKYCHEKGVCHRDLKPENLLLSDMSDHATLKMADFGLSAVIFAMGDRKGPERTAERITDRGAFTESHRRRTLNLNETQNNQNNEHINTTSSGTEQDESVISEGVPPRSPELVTPAPARVGGSARSPIIAGCTLGQDIRSPKSPMSPERMPSVNSVLRVHSVVGSPHYCAPEICAAGIVLFAF